MRGVAPLRKAAWLARIASLMTILALIVAPACAPLCAAQACPQAPVSAGMGSHCHSSEVANGGAVHLYSVQGCGSPELQVANLPSANTRESLPKTPSPPHMEILSLLHPSPLTPHPPASRP